MVRKLRPILIGLVLGTLGFLGNRMSVGLFPYVDLLFGATIPLIAIGASLSASGMLAGVIASLATYLLWGHPWAIPVFSLEVLWVAWQFSRGRRILTAILAYWLLFGIPFVIGLYHFLMGVSLQAAALIALKQSVNGIINALLATIILDVSRIATRSPRLGRQISFEQIIYLTMMSVVIFPATIFLVLDVRAIQDRQEREMIEDISAATATSAGIINTALAGKLKAVSTLAELVGDPSKSSFERMQGYAETLHRAARGFLRMGVIDLSGRSVAFSPLLDENGKSTLGIDFSDRPHIAVMKSTLQPVVADVLPAKTGTSGFRLPLVAPIVEKEAYRGYAFGVLDLEDLKGQMESATGRRLLMITVVDRHGRVVVPGSGAIKPMAPYGRHEGQKLRDLDDGIVHWSPVPLKGVSRVQSWTNSVLIKETMLSPEIEWKIIVESPMAPLVDKLNRELSEKLLRMLVLILLSVPAAHLISSHMARALNKLAAVTVELPPRILANQKVDWPVSALQENQRLISNFKMMTESLARDIELRRQADEALTQAKMTAETASKTKSMFLANMSHEIRTPLNGVLGLAQLVLESDLTPEQRDNMQAIVTSGRTLLTLVNDILDFSKIEADKISITLAPFSLSELVERITHLLKPRLDEKRIRFTVHMPPSLPRWVEGDDVRIGQILLNILGNAIKFTPAGGAVVLSINPAPSSKLLNAGFQDWRFSVSDTGVGIPEHLLKEVFEPFRQVDGSDTRQYGGAGLGLAISKRLVQLMGGEIFAESGVEAGAVFHFVVKLRATELEPSVEAGSGDASTNDSNAGRRLRVLVVEDNVVNQKLVLRLLQKRHHSVSIASNGKQALELFASSKAGFDLILMDCQMPEMNGFQCTAEIRSLEAIRGGHIPIIAMTAHAMEGDRKRCIQSGMDSYIAKPIVIDEFLDLIARVVSSAGPSTTQQHELPP